MLNVLDGNESHILFSFLTFFAVDGFIIIIVVAGVAWILGIFMFITMVILNNTDRKKYIY